jgi:N-acetyl-gamma-glutamyl-phosphate reductase
MIQAGIVGVTGYTGHELAIILSRHPGVSLLFATSQSQAGKTLDELYPAAPPIAIASQDDAPWDLADIVFLCLPHAGAAPVARKALQAGARVVDLSADFRLRDAETYATWYGSPHPAPDLLAEAVYGLTEFARKQLPGSRLVANPGCYPTSVLLALQPVLAADAAQGMIIADAKSGVSGAGRAMQQHLHFVEVADNFYPYRIGRAHRHLPEMEQAMRTWRPDPPPLIFSPHLLPVPRGILTTLYVPLRPGWTEAALRSLYYTAYLDEPFVDLLPAGRLASLAAVVHTNRCVLSLTVADDMLIIVSAIDNLVKGAAGQAVQNMNVMFGQPETAGLETFA